MTIDEAIYIISAAQGECEWNAPLNYQEAFDIALEAMRRQATISPIYLGLELNSRKYWLCPSCKKAHADKHNFCPDCGQALDWNYATKEENE